MLSLSSQASFAQISFPWSSPPQGSPPVQAQSDDADADMRIQRLENQLRQLTGQNEELQYRNRQLEDRLRQLGGAARQAPAGQPPAAQPSAAAMPPPAQPSARPATPRRRAIRKDSRVIRRRSRDTSSRRSPLPRRSCRSGQHRRRPAAAAAMPSIRTRIRSARRAARARRRPAADANDAPVGAPGGRGAGEPLDLGRPARATPVALRPPLAPGASGRIDDLAALGDTQGRVRSRHRLHAAQGLCAGRGDHEEFRAEISERSPDRGFAILARRELFPAPAISRRRGGLPRA